VLPKVKGQTRDIAALDICGTDVEHLGASNADIVPLSVRCVRHNVSELEARTNGRSASRDVSDHEHEVGAGQLWCTEAEHIDLSVYAHKLSLSQGEQCAVPAGTSRSTQSSRASRLSRSCR
jgi:hypothetical protein